MARFWYDFALKNAFKYDVIFVTALGQFFVAFPIPRDLHFGALAYTRLQFSHFRVYGKVLKNASIFHGFRLPFSRKNASNMSSFFYLIFPQFFISVVHTIIIHFPQDWDLPNRLRINVSVVMVL